VATEAAALSKLGDPVTVDWALGHAAVNSRFAEADLSSIVSHHARVNAGPRHQAGETRSLTRGPEPGRRCSAETTSPHPGRLDDVAKDTGKEAGR
jgi:hypothetical protein